jgi:hypothetical protein
VDENEPVVPLQRVVDSVDGYGDPNWEPELVDAGPGGWFICFFYLPSPTKLGCGVWFHSTQP